MYSCSATLQASARPTDPTQCARGDGDWRAVRQDYVSREVYHMTGKWLEEYIDRRLEELGLR